jgi:hypothetical protein
MAKKKTATGGGSFGLEELAKELVSFWANNSDSEIAKTWQDKSVPAAEVFNSLRKLATSGILDTGILDVISSKSKKVEFAIAAIKTFQGIASRKKDGILGRVTRGLADRFRGCDEARQATKPATGRADGAAELGLLFFHLEDDLLNLTVDGMSAEEMVNNAIAAWTTELALTMKYIKDAKHANIVMKLGGDSSFGVSGGVLAVGTIGGPDKNFQLELKFDPAEDWGSSTSFITTCMHELGHNLGLMHLPPGNLMAAFKDETVLTPRKADLDEAKRIWGPA